MVFYISANEYLIYVCIMLLQSIPVVYLGMHVFHVILANFMTNRTSINRQRGSEA